MEETKETINNSIDETIIDNDSLTKPKVKKPRTQKQIEAFEKARKKRLEKLELKKKEKESLEEKEEEPTIEEKINEYPPPTERVLSDIDELEEETIIATQSTESLPKDATASAVPPLEKESPPKPKRKYVKKPRENTKTIKIIKKKKPKPPPKEIIYENSDSDTDDDELLKDVYMRYKEELKNKKKPPKTNTDKKSFKEVKKSINFV